MRVSPCRRPLPASLRARRLRAPPAGAAHLLRSVARQDDLAEVMRRTDLIVWDEAPTMGRHCFEAVDRMLRDIMCNNVLFGGKVLCAPPPPPGSALPWPPRAARRAASLAAHARRSWFWAATSGRSCRSSSAAAARRSSAQAWASPTFGAGSLSCGCEPTCACSACWTRRARPPHSPSPRWSAALSRPPCLPYPAAVR